MTDNYYSKIWEKTLGEGEKVEYEFSIGGRYRVFMILFWLVLSLPLLLVLSFLEFFIFGLGIITFFTALFYYGFYVKKANAYAFTNKRMLIHKGWLSTSLISIDYQKITDTFVSEPFFDKLFTHTGSLTVNTAGTSGPEVVLKHIETPYEVKKKLDQIKSG